MASTTGGKRPLSPHLTIYRPQITSILSIFHRAAGCFMALSMALVVWWFLAAASGPDYFAFIDGLLTSWIGALIMLGSAAAFFYHLCNGIRHMWWDIGNGFELNQATRSGIAVLIGAGALTLIILFVAL
ncbi:succinate dehydrogenase, cytochrome b556 subunit [Pikeienuella piscinae]|uniref:Succinate dehydrogenase cytochrome b556 subunit n=1 Tax=Pikeienuella piscinae TaxID=2748098 RepID=A0A7L5BYK3_9RHOB|nr:succinate dehydrogenase, cytochrome b556 subunit [Pikeienuella piscinae]QIE56822.1 succinate dehydrogenase, cytochrome b556 subunit [Pikeienuella piscinae]